MIAIIHKNKTAITDILLEIFPLILGELDKFMTTEITERAPENLPAAERDNVFLRINRNERFYKIDNTRFSVNIVMYALMR